jgi:hypothetical protein
MGDELNQGKATKREPVKALKAKYYLLPTQSSFRHD